MVRSLVQPYDDMFTNATLGFDPGAFDASKAEDARSLLGGCDRGQSGWAVDVT
jgi:hypothetical protein